MSRRDAYQLRVNAFLHNRPHRHFHALDPLQMNGVEHWPGGGVPARLAALGPDRNAVAPPELSRNRPVALLSQPAQILLGVSLGKELDPAIAHHFQCRFGQRRHSHKPLVRQIRLDRRLGPVRVPHLRLVRLLFDQQAVACQIVQHALSGLVSLHAGIRPAILVDLAIRRQDVDQVNLIGFALMSLPHGIVVRIMRRCHLHHAGAELGVHQDVIGDNGNLPPHQRQTHLETDCPVPTWILRVHSHRRVPQHCLRARRGHNHLSRPTAVTSLLRRFVALHNRIRNVPQRRLDRLMINLVVRDRCLQMRIPVHQPLAAVDQSVLEQLEKRLAYGPGAHLIQREARAVPVARASQAFELFDDPVTVLLFPLPDAGDQTLAADVVPGFILLLFELLFHDRLCGDAGVVDARHPDRVLALHARLADEDVLQCVVDGMPQMQSAGHVGRWNHDAVWLTRQRRIGHETLLIQPHLVHLGFNGCGFISLGKFAAHRLFP